MAIGLGGLVGHAARYQENRLGAQDRYAAHLHVVVAYTCKVFRFLKVFATVRTHTSSKRTIFAPVHAVQGHRPILGIRTFGSKMCSSAAGTRDCYSNTVLEIATVIPYVHGKLNDTIPHRTTPTTETTLAHRSFVTITTSAQQRQGTTNSYS